MKAAERESKKQKRTFANPNKTEDNIPENKTYEGSIEHGVDLQTGGRLSSPEYEGAGESQDREIWDAASHIIFGLIRAIGLIMLGFGIVQVGLSLKSHDPSQRANGFLTVAGGIVITFAKEILNLITG